MRKVLLVYILLLFTSCALQKEETKALDLRPTDFSELSGWNDDNHEQALQTLLLSCPQIIRKYSQNTSWKEACNAAKTTHDTKYSAKQYFETWFQPYAASSSGNEQGLFTGYYMPELSASLDRNQIYNTPIYETPNDLISVDLGAFKSSLSGQRIVGKVSKGKLIPYDSRATIAQGALTDKAQPIAWTNDPIGAFFLEVQGSGLLSLTDGSKMPIGYAATNGKSYASIGKILADRGDIQRPVTMQKIREWLAQHPDKAQSVMNENESYVFFRKLPSSDAIGAEGIPLTPTRSLAVDRSYINLGTPIWLETKDGKDRDIKRLVIAQDTGGAIKGPVRGDFYWGTGEEAAIQAGAMQNPGRYYILQPKGSSTYER